jgi:hypothetical protein
MEFSFYVYQYITNICRTQAKAILNHVNQNIVVLGKEKQGITNVTGLNLAAVRPMTIQLTVVSE